MTIRKESTESGYLWKAKHPKNFNIFLEMEVWAEVKDEETVKYKSKDLKVFIQPFSRLY